MNQILSVKNDFVFKKIFGEKGCETVLASFLECVLDISIDYIEIRGDRELVGAYLGDKTSIIDVYAIINDGIKLNIEMQLGNEYNIFKRTLYYYSKLLMKDFEQGDKYKDLQKGIMINILDFNCLDRDDYHSIFKLKDQNNEESRFNDVLEIHFIELKKVKNSKRDDLLKYWLQFMQTTDREELELLRREDKELNKAVGMLLMLSGDEGVRDEADRRFKAECDYNSDMGAAERKGREEGIGIGREEGLNEGIGIGRKEGLTKGIDIGREEGLSKGIDIGRKEGLNKGINIGREEGIDIGREEGLDMGERRQLKKQLLMYLKYISLKESLQQEIVDFLDEEPENTLIEQLLCELMQGNMNAVCSIIK